MRSQLAIPVPYIRDARQDALKFFIYKLYVANVGSLTVDFTLKKLMNKHTLNPYNPNIAYAFYLTGFVERAGDMAMKRSVML